MTSFVHTSLAQSRNILLFGVHAGIILLLIIGIHGFNSKSAGGSRCCCTSIQYCCIHGARSQRVAQSKAFTAFVVPTASEEARKPSHTHCAEKRQRPPSTSLHEKVEQKNVAHVMNDEAQRKYLTSFKRLMKFEQDRRPDVAPSKKVL